jgi:adenylate cyclase class IV
MKPTHDPFHACEVKFRIPSEHAYEAWERRLRSIGFERTGRQLETDLVFDTEDFACRSHGLMLRLRHIQTEEDRQDILLTLKRKGTTPTFQECFEYAYAFSSVDAQVFEHINQLLTGATGRQLPDSIHAFTPTQFNELCAAVRRIFPALHLHLQKKRITYTYGPYQALFDTLPSGLEEYLVLEAPSPEELTLLARALMIDDNHRIPLDYGEILKQEIGKRGSVRLTGLFRTEERVL